jgi:hypothetical protein
MANNDNPRDPAQLSLGSIIAKFPAVRAARKKAYRATDDAKAALRETTIPSRPG